LKLGTAYETLKDESKRRAYDLIYPSIQAARPSPQATQTPRRPPASTWHSEVHSEAAQIVALQKSKQERGARWQIKKAPFDSSIFELQRERRRLEQEIKSLDSIVAAEAAEVAWKKSWTSWLLSPLYRELKESEEEKARKDRERQERRIERDMKERRLALKRAVLKKEEGLLGRAKEAVDAADLVDDGKIRAIQERIWARERLERLERERVEREMFAKILKQQQREREAAERWAEERAAEQERREEQARELQRIVDDAAQRRRDLHGFFFAAEGSARRASPSSCRHDGWWPKEQGRSACPKCSEIWTYLLRCPACNMKACPRCQGEIRPRRARYTARTYRGAPPVVRPSSPGSYWDDY